MAPDTRQIELIGRAALETELIKHGFEIARPHRDKGIDLMEELPEGDENLGKIFLLLRQHTGSDFTYYKASTIQRRIKRRMLLNKIDRLGDYVRYMHQTPLEVDALQVTKKDTVQIFCMGSVIGKWCISHLCHELQTTIDNKSSFDDYVVEHDFENIGAQGNGRERTCYGRRTGRTPCGLDADRRNIEKILARG